MLHHLFYKDAHRKEPTIFGYVAFFTILLGPLIGLGILSTIVGLPEWIVMILGLGWWFLVEQVVRKKRL